MPARVARSTHYPSWGLETPAIGKAALNTTAAHYPSWGLETPVPIFFKLNASPLITPHGDWKPRMSLRNPCCTGCSLPLMGIGNARCAGAPERPGISHYPSWGLETARELSLECPHTVLITPHGDWKLVFHRRLSADACFLITPHGDWKPAVPVRDGDPAFLITPHGDWKPPLFAAIRPGSPGSHYPSWGLETSFTDIQTTDIQTSLPLMGIGNPVPGHPARRAHRLITPHGDWKPAVAHHSVSRRRTPHYPSWGLETPKMAPSRISAKQLITPHGDWKRRLKRASSAICTVAHYPSWGLETSFMPARPCADGFSLPLMGIGNLFHPHANVRVIGLITPHGDWKPCNERHDTGARLQLITPHGDWKPTLYVLFAGVSPCSLPLMGIGNDARLRRHSGRSGSLPLMGIGNIYFPAHPWPFNVVSLPLMGIGNHEHHDPPDPGHHLITPHGDWKRPRQRLRSVELVVLITPHGDWKRKRSPHAPGASSAHYPSWGLETPLSRLRRVREMNSLPLMGIGNLMKSIPYRHNQLLITPHGDWKPC